MARSLHCDARLEREAWEHRHVAVGDEHVRGGGLGPEEGEEGLESAGVDEDRVEGDGAKRATDGARARSGLVFVVAEQQGLDGVIATEVEEVPRDAPKGRVGRRFADSAHRVGREAAVVLEDQAGVEALGLSPREHAPERPEAAEGTLVPERRPLAMAKRVPADSCAVNPREALEVGQVDLRGNIKLFNHTSNVAKSE